MEAFVASLSGLPQLKVLDILLTPKVKGKFIIREPNSKYFQQEFDLHVTLNDVTHKCWIEKPTQ